MRTHMAIQQISLDLDNCIKAVQKCTDPTTTVRSPFSNPTRPNFKQFQSPLSARPNSHKFKFKFKIPHSPSRPLVLLPYKSLHPISFPKKKVSPPNPKRRSTRPPPPWQSRKNAPYNPPPPPTWTPLHPPDPPGKPSKKCTRKKPNSNTSSSGPIPTSAPSRNTPNPSGSSSRTSWSTVRSPSSPASTRSSTRSWSMPPITSSETPRWTLSRSSSTPKRIVLACTTMGMEYRSRFTRKRRCTCLN